MRAILSQASNEEGATTIPGKEVHQKPGGSAEQPKWLMI